MRFAARENAISRRSARRYAIGASTDLPRLAAVAGDERRVRDVCSRRRTLHDRSGRWRRESRARGAGKVRLGADARSWSRRWQSSAAPMCARSETSRTPGSVHLIAELEFDEREPRRVAGRAGGHRGAV